MNKPVFLNVIKLFFKFKLTRCHPLCMWSRKDDTLDKEHLALEKETGLNRFDFSVSCIVVSPTEDGKISHFMYGGSV